MVVNWVSHSVAAWEHMGSIIQGNLVALPLSLPTVGQLALGMIQSERSEVTNLLLFIDIPRLAFIVIILSRFR